MTGRVAKYTVSRKRSQYIFASNFAKCWPAFKILSPTGLAVNFNKAIIIHLATPQTHRYSTLLTISVRKKRQQPEMCILVYDNSHSNVATILRLLHYDFTAYSALKEYLKSVDIWRSYGNKVDCLKRSVRRGALSCWKMKNSLDIWRMAGTNCCIKAKFHYASWFEAGSKLVADRFEAKFIYAIWFESASNQLRTSSEPASVGLMEFGFNLSCYDNRPH